MQIDINIRHLTHQQNITFLHQTETQHESLKKKKFGSMLCQCQKFILFSTVKDNHKNKF